MFLLEKEKQKRTKHAVAQGSTVWHSRATKGSKPTRLLLAIRNEVDHTVGKAAKRHRVGGPVNQRSQKGTLSGRTLQKNIP